MHTRCTGEPKSQRVLFVLCYSKGLSAWTFWSDWYVYLICSYFVSAKTGDNVAAAFYHIVADLSGIVLTPPDVSTVAKVVTAQVIEHPQDTLKYNTSSDRIRIKSKCSIM